MVRFKLHLLFVLILLGSFGHILPGTMATVADDEPKSKTTQLGFVEDVRPFLKANCFKCHGANRQENDFALHDLKRISTDQSKTTDSARWELILEKLASGEMPPKDEVQPDKISRGKMVRWIQNEVKAAGHQSQWERKLLFPEYGNYVDHDQLLMDRSRMSLGRQVGFGNAARSFLIRC